MKKKAPLILKIKDVEWSFQVQSNATYIRAHGRDSEAITYPYDKEVFFNTSSFSPYSVKHELVHVYVASSSTSSSGLDADQIEELCAELYGEHSNEMDALAEKILNYFMR